MASGKGKSSKQKRSSQNRQQRAARQARAANAATAPRSTAGGGEDAGSGARSAGGGGSTSLLGRLRGGGGGRAARPAARPAPSSRTGGGARASAAQPADLPPMTDRRGQPIGYRAALTALLAAIAAVGASLLFHTAVDQQGDPYTQSSIVAEWGRTALDASVDLPADAEPAAVVKAVGEDWMPRRGSDRIFSIYFPWTLAALLPIGASYLLFTAVRQRRGAKTVNRAMYATLLGSVICLPLLQFFFPTLAAAWFAGYQVRRAEMAAARAAGDAGGSAAGGAVIEADVVEPEIVEADVVEADVVDADVVEAEVVDDADAGAAGDDDRA
jgi:hypothetical protein